MRLFWRLFFTFGAAIAVTLVGAIYVSARFADQAFGTLDFDGSEEIIQTAATILQEHGELGLRLWLANTMRATDNVDVLIVDPYGNELLNRPIPTQIASWLREPPGLTNRPANVRPLQLNYEIVGNEGQEYRVVFVPKQVSFLGIMMWRGSQPVILAVTLLVAAVSSLLLARYLAWPIVRLQGATRALAAGELDTRVGPPVNRRRDETGRLAQDFDKMAERLQALVTDKETLLRDVSHEFRSPLARIRVAVALAQRRAGDAAQQDLVRIEHETEKLDELVGQVMTLSRLRTATGPKQAPVVLSDLVTEVVEDARFEHPDAEIRLDASPAPAFLGDAAGLQSAVENVLRNALKHAKQDGPIDVAVRTDGDTIEVSVRDRGPGVPTDDVQRIFEPFFRVDTSRDHQVDGQGIGLAITARVMELHGGRASARNHPDGGLEVTLSVPTAREEAGGRHGKRRKRQT